MVDVLNKNIFFYVAWNTLCRLSELTFGVLTYDLELWIAANQKSDQQDASNGAVDRCIVCTSAWKSSIRRFVITKKAPTRAFSWLKAATAAFTFKTLLRHYAKRALTPRSLNVKLGPQRKGHKGRAVWLA